MNEDLIWAVFLRDAPAVAACLARGAQPCAIGKLGGSALHLAARLDAAITGTLLCAGADTDVRSATGHTPLHWAAANSNTAACELLLSSGADADAVEPDGGLTPLHCAVSAGSVDCVTVLLLAGADAGARRGDGYTPLDIARLCYRFSKQQALVSALRGPTAAAARWSGLRRAALTAWCVCG